MSSPIRILIVDDQHLIRQALRGLLELEDDFQVVGEAADGDEALALAVQLAPDLILLDLMMPVKSGLEVLPEIRHHQPQTRVLILTASMDQEIIVRAMQLGAAGCLFKNISAPELMKAIRAAVHDELPLDPIVASMLIRKLNQPPSVPHHVVLTQREQEILAYLAQGASNGVIAQTLDISEMTVRTHVSRILRKLNVPSRTQAALYFLKQQTQ
jgi:DNA-binding NarL/FixJ family response regulator